MRPILACAPLLAVACGGLTGIDTNPFDGPFDAGSDVSPPIPSPSCTPCSFEPDASEPAVDADTFDSSEDAAPAPGVDAGVAVDGDANWEASPYVPAVDIAVDHVALYTTGGRLAILAASSNGPGGLLFVGSTAVTDQPAWQDIPVDPPLSLRGGQLYWLAQQSITGYCSFASAGPENVEWDSDSLDGGWYIAGTDSWIARIYGTCASPK